MAPLGNCVASSGRPAFRRVLFVCWFYFSRLLILKRLLGQFINWGAICRPFSLARGLLRKHSCPLFCILWIVTELCYMSRCGKVGYCRFFCRTIDVTCFRSYFRFSSFTSPTFLGFLSYLRWFSAVSLELSFGPSIHCWSRGCFLSSLGLCPGVPPSCMRSGVCMFGVGWCENILALCGLAECT